MANLPVPTWANEVPGNFITSALWTQNVYNNGTFLTNPPIFAGYQNTSQSLSNQSWTSLAIDTTVVDTYGGHSNTTNNSRYTAQVPGWYTCCGVYAPAGFNNGFRAARLQVNGYGSPVLGSGVYLSPNGGIETGITTPSRDIYLNAGDYVEVAGWQSSGSSLNTILDVDLRCGLWVRWSHA